MTGNLKTTATKKFVWYTRHTKNHLLKSGDYFKLIVDTGWSKLVTPNMDEFVPGYLTTMDEPMFMDEISGILIATHKGRVWYDVINNAGGLSIL